MMLYEEGIKFGFGRSGLIFQIIKCISKEILNKFFPESFLIDSSIKK